MEPYCENNFLNLKSWNSMNSEEVPDFSICFEETILVWIPCVIFWLLSIYDIYWICKSNNRCLPWNFLNASKLSLSICLIILSVLELFNSLLLISISDPYLHYNPLIKVLTFTLSAAIIYLQKRRGLHTSSSLFFFWLLLSLSSTANYRTILSIIFLNGIYNNIVTDFMFAIRMASSPIIFCQLFLSIFPDTYPIGRRTDNKECPLNTASFLSIVTFWWVNPLVGLGYKKSLTLADMWRPIETLITRNNVSKFNKYYYKTQYKLKELSIIGSDSTLIIKQTEKIRRKGVFLPLLRTDFLLVLYLFLLKLLTTILIFIGPIVLDWMITFVKTPSEPNWWGYVYALLLFFSSMITSLVGNHSQYYSNLVRIKLRSCLVNAIYVKSLLLSNDGRKDFSIGEIVNLMVIDTHRIVEIIRLMNSLWSLPLQISISIYLLWQQLGIATLAGVAVMIILLPINGFVAMRLRLIQTSLMLKKDRRIKLLNEILSGIRVWKMYAWEESFTKKIMKLRNSEISKLIKRAFYSGFLIFSFNSAQTLVSVISFAVFVLIDDNNILDANKAFVSLTLFGILGRPLNRFPAVITNFVMFSVSTRRVNKYLNSDEIDFDAIERNDNYEEPIGLEDASFVWSADDVIPTLNRITLKIRKQTLIAVVGQVGSGKSSLLSAILGEMVKIEGRVYANGDMAYVPQEAWIMSTTLKDNILFAKPMDRRKFDKVLECCALKQDLEFLAGGELTEIGENGINLSGGQKQRIAMARACYSDADIYLLDDPISALDSNVGKYVFDKVIGPNGILKEKTRILVTHRISVLPNVDQIVVMKNGSISECGTYRELMERKGDFADFLLQYLETTDEGFNEEEIEVYDEIMSKIKNQKFDVRSQPKSIDSEEGLRQRSRSQRGSLKGSLKGSLQEKSAKTKEKKSGKLTDEEVSETGSVKLRVYLNYLKKVGICSLIAVFLSDVSVSGLNFGSSLWLAEWSDDSLDPNKWFDSSLRDLRLGVYGVLGVAQTVFVLVATISITLACLRGAKILHNEMLVHMMRAPISHFDTTPMGRILNRFSKDIDVADTVLGMSIRMVMMRFFSAIVSFAIIGYETPFVFLAVIPLGIVYYFIQRYYISTSRQLRRIQSNARSPVIGHFSETLSGASSIRAYGMSREFIDESNLRVDIFHNTTFESMISNRWLSTRLEFLGYSIVLVDALFVVFTRHTVSPGLAGLSLSYAMKITGTLNQMVTASTQLETDIVSVERCVEYTQTPTEAQWFNTATKPDRSWPQNGSIRFQDYSTKYRDGLDLVLKRISFTIPPRKRVGIVGRTGAGKTSLTLALFRLLEPTNGTIFIDSIDISKIGLYELRSRLTIIPQDPVLFTGTLRINLDPFDGYKDEEIWTALELAHLKAFVMTLPLKLNHPLSESGNNFSVGQKQLICLARALLRRTRILILDEATAAVDVETDELIQETIRKEFKDCTIVTIAHRLNTIMDYDLVLVMDSGRVREYDSPTVLLANQDSMFYALSKSAGLV